MDLSRRDAFRPCSRDMIRYFTWLYISRYPFISTNLLLAAMSFFPVSSKIPYAYFLNGSTPKKKTASNMLLRSTNIANKVYDVQTMQTKFGRFRQKSSGY